MIDSKSDIFFSDLKRIFNWHRKKILTCFFACLASLFVIIFQMEPSFVTKASFQKEVNLSKQESPQALKSFLQKHSGMESNVSEAISIMESDFLRQGIIQKLGLQVNVQPDGTYAEIKHKFLKKIRSISLKEMEKEKYFLFEKVSYGGLQMKTLFLKVLEDGCFAILDNERKQIALSSLGKKVALEDMSFTLSNIPVTAAFEEIHKLSFSPMWKELSKMKKRLKIVEGKKHSSILSLSYSHCNPYLAKDTLNKLMLAYKAYLYRQSAKLAKLQREYLEKRQLELTQKMDDQLQEYATELCKNFSQSGLFTFEQKVNKDMKRKALIETTIFELTQELKGLSNKQGNWLPQTTQSGAARQIYSLKNEIKEYSRKKKEAELELLFSFSNSNNLLPKAIAKYKMLTDTSSLQRFPFSQVSSLQETKPFFVSEILRQEYEDLPILLRGKAPFTIHMDHLIGLKREILRENHLELIERDLADIDFTTCEKMLRDSKSDLDQLKEKSRTLFKGKEDFYKRDFDLQSLPKCNANIESLLVKIYELKLNMNDKYLLTKERDHLEERIEEYEKALYQLLEKEIKETEKAIAIGKERVKDLQQLLILRLNKKIILAKNALVETVDTYKAEIEGEVNRLRLNLDHIKQDASDFTSSWLQDNKFEMRKKLGLTIMEGVTKVYEAKNIENNIYKDSSKIIDPAMLPVKPQNKFIILLSLFFALLFTIFYFGLIVAKRLRKGDLYTHERLEEQGYMSFENLDAKDLRLDRQSTAVLEALRKLSIFLGDDSKIISVISTKYAMVSQLLAELYALENKKTLLITLESFTSNNSSKEFEKYLTGNTSYLPVKHQEGYDLLAIGNLDPFAAEKIKSEKFQIFLSRVGAGYDKVICFMATDPAKAAPYILSSYCDKTILGYNLDTTDLNCYFDVEKRREMPCLGFIEEKA